jgi:hypothetical protein
MIEVIDNMLHISNWEKYQSADKLLEIREYNRIAKQKSRAKQKRLPHVNDMSMTCQPCQDIEEEGDKDKEKESHSLTLSREEAKLKFLGGTLGGGVVMLSDEQFADLCEKLSFEELNKYIAIVRDCEKSGQHYKKKTHYQAILDMVKKDRRVK